MKSQKLQLLLREYHRKKVLTTAYSEAERAELLTLREKIAQLQAKLTN